MLYFLLVHNVLISNCYHFLNLLMVTKIISILLPQMLSLLLFYLVSHVISHKKEENTQVVGVIYCNVLIKKNYNFLYCVIQISVQLLSVFLFLPYFLTTFSTLYKMWPHGHLALANGLYKLFSALSVSTAWYLLGYFQTSYSP